MADSQHDRFIVKTLREVADFFGVQETTVRIEWRHRTKMPGEEGRYDLAAIARWKLNRMREATPPAAAAEKTNVEIAVLHERRQHLSMRNAMMAGTVLDRDATVQEVSIIMQTIRDWMQGIPDLLEMEFPPEVRRETKRRCQELINIGMKQVSESLLAMPEAPPP